MATQKLSQGLNTASSAIESSMSFYDTHKDQIKSISNNLQHLSDSLQNINVPQSANPTLEIPNKISGGKENKTKITTKTRSRRNTSSSSSSRYY